MICRSFADAMHDAIIACLGRSQIGKRKFLCLALPLALLPAVNGWSQGKAFPVPTAVPEPTQPGGPWLPLFDGESLSGWRETLFTDRGEVWIENGTIILEAGLLTGITWTGDFPKSNFEIQFEATRLKGNDFFAGMTFPVGDSFCTLIIGGWGGGTIGLSSVDGWDASSNQTTDWRDFDNERWYSLRLRVTDEEICAWLDDKVIITQALKGRKISLRYGEIKLSAPFGFASYRTTAGLRKLEYRILYDSGSKTE